MIIENTEYPVRNPHSVYGLQYLMVAVGRFEIGNDTERYRAAEVLIEGYRDPFSLEGRREFDTREECQRFCDAHNATLRLTAIEKENILAKSSGRVIRESTKACGFCQTRSHYNAAYCYNCEQPFVPQPK